MKNHNPGLTYLLNKVIMVLNVQKLYEYFIQVIKIIGYWCKAHKKTDFKDSICKWKKN